MILSFNTRKYFTFYTVANTLTPIHLEGSSQYAILMGVLCRNTYSVTHGRSSSQYAILMGGAVQEYIQVYMEEIESHIVGGIKLHMEGVVSQRSGEIM